MKMEAHSFIVLPGSKGRPSSLRLGCGEELTVQSHQNCLMTSGTSVLFTGSTSSTWPGLNLLFALSLLTVLRSEDKGPCRNQPSWPTPPASAPRCRLTLRT